MLRFGKFVVLASMAIAMFSNESLGCSCGGEPYTNKSIDEIRAEKRDYFLYEFKGAAFSGKIFERERVSVNWWAKTPTGESATSQMYRYTIRVKEYWFGVTSRMMIVYGEPPEQIWDDGGGSGSSCGFKLNNGQSYFFTPSLYRNNLLIGQCDFAGGGSNPVVGRAAEFRKIMGKPKRF